MKKLVFEQIGTGNTRFRLLKDNYTIEINYHNPKKLWMVDCFDQKIRQSINISYGNHAGTYFTDIKLALEAVNQFFGGVYTMKIGANDYPNYKTEVKKFCGTHQLEFDFNQVNSDLLNEFEDIVNKSCDCSKEKFNFFAHTFYCPMHPSNK